MPELKLEHLSIEESILNECTAIVAIEPNVIEPNISGAPLLDKEYNPITISEYIALKVVYNVYEDSTPRSMAGDRIIEDEWCYIESIKSVGMREDGPYLECQKYFEIAPNVLLDTTQDGMDSFKIDMDLLLELLLELLKNNETELLTVEREE